MNAVLIVQCFDNDDISSWFLIKKNKKKKTPEYSTFPQLNSQSSPTSAYSMNNLQMVNNMDLKLSGHVFHCDNTSKTISF